MRNAANFLATTRLVLVQKISRQDLALAAPIILLQSAPQSLQLTLQW